MLLIVKLSRNSNHSKRLYTSYLSAIIYCFLGSSKDLAVGPQSLMSLLTAEYCTRPHNWIPLEGAGNESKPLYRSNGHLNDMV